MISISAVLSRTARNAHLALALALTLTTFSGERATLTASIWPAHGQAAVAVSIDGQTQRASHADDAPAPIASMAKVMTAYVVLERHPLTAQGSGYSLTITAAEAEDTQRRTAEGQSVVPVRAGLVLTQRQALEALLLPSANNIAAVLARREAGSEAKFVRWMNKQAAELGMRSTRYTDPSGYDAATVSTAADQVRLARAAMRLPAFAAIVGQQRAELPYAGTVENTDELLGQHGFVGIKTGSMTAADGCFMFMNVQAAGGRRVVIVGVVMGQRGRHLTTAGQRAAERLVDRIHDRIPGSLLDGERLSPAA